MGWKQLGKGFTFVFPPHLLNYKIKTLNPNSIRLSFCRPENFHRTNFVGLKQLFCLRALQVHTNNTFQIRKKCYSWTNELLCHQFQDGLEMPKRDFRALDGKRHGVRLTQLEILDYADSVRVPRKLCRI